MKINCLFYYFSISCLFLKPHVSLYTMSTYSLPLDMHRRKSWLHPFVLNPNGWWWRVCSEEFSSSTSFIVSHFGFNLSSTHLLKFFTPLLWQQLIVSILNMISCLLFGKAATVFSDTEICFVIYIMIIVIFLWVKYSVKRKRWWYLCVSVFVFCGLAKRV